jgi:putative membrane protein
MFWYQWNFIGMNLLWWLFWIAMVIALFAVATPVPRRRLRRWDDPFTILQRRYAAGDLTTEEYEERKARIARDLQDPPHRPAPVPARMEQNAPAR